MEKSLLNRLESVTARLESIAANMGGGAPVDGVPPYVEKFEEIMKNQLAEVIKTSKALKIPKSPNYLEKAYNNLFELIKIVHKCKKPSPQDLSGFMAVAQKAIKDADTQCARGKKFKTFGNHYKALKESTAIVAFATMGPPNGTPKAHAESQRDSAEFHINRVLKDNKDPESKAWIKALKGLNADVAKFVIDNFKVSMPWNPKGEPLSKDVKPEEKPKKAPKKEESKESSENKNKKPEKNIGNVFGELNKGLKITSGLNKVTKKMKTKNRKNKTGKVIMKTVKKKGRKKGAPILALQGMRWNVGNHNEGVVTVDKTQIKHTVYISMGDNATYDVQGKVKSVAIDNCKRCRVFIDEVVSTVELINCSRLDLFCRDVVPSVSVEKCDSVNVTLDKKTMQKPPHIYSSNITAVTVTIPVDGEQKNLSLPEQFQTTIDPKTGKISTKETEH